MPIYDFKCDACELVEVDKMLKRWDDPNINCPECGKIMDRLPNGFAVKMKMPWLSKMEQKWGKQGHPYKNEDGSTKAGVDDSPPIVPGPKTKARWKDATEKGPPKRNE
jgi:putative FmdB family regulatory protein